MNLSKQYHRTNARGSLCMMKHRRIFDDNTDERILANERDESDLVKRSELMQLTYTMTEIFTIFKLVSESSLTLIIEIVQMAR